jgi:pyruvate dehydrogenase E2 component (dihydrolipoamide acetyltransferase)
MAEFTMPSLGADMAAGTLVEWLVKPGDTVKRGDLVAVVETDKGAMEIEFFEDGVIDELVVQPDAKVPVGTPLAMFTPAHSVPERPVPAPEDPVTVPVPESRPPEPTPTPAPTASGVRASPAAKHRARELGVDLSALSGSGPAGAVVLADLDGALPATASTPPAPESPTDPMRSAIAAAMSRSKREIPHYYLGADIDLHPATTWLEAHNADRPVTERVLYAALLIRAVALACRKYPELNGTWEQGRFVPGDGVHVGVAVSLRGGGLVAPAIRDADTLSVDQTMQALGDLVERARRGRLRRTEMTGATITLSNLGPRGVPVMYPIITPPQVAIVGFGRVMERPWVVDGEIVVRPVLVATLAADHRATDGHTGAVFLRRIETLLLKPNKLEAT